MAKRKKPAAKKTAKKAAPKKSARASLRAELLHKNLRLPHGYEVVIRRPRKKAAKKAKSRKK